MFHKGALEPVGFSAFLGAEGNELESTIHSAEDGRPTVLKAVEKLNPALVEKPFPQGLATLVCVDTTGYYDAHMPAVIKHGEKLFQKELGGVNVAFAQCAVTQRFLEIGALLTKSVAVFF
ncbi:MAG: hypothetical protein U9N19_07145, partial [Thermodesulfobacteriota bacterium]|nr:hypothetical protein [Thermodesulfobacteriota bacterium]